MNGEAKRTTSVLPVDIRNIGKISAQPNDDDILDTLQIDLDSQTQDVAHMRFAAEELKHSDIPVAFPTETVYGLGADATRSAAVNGIYKAKQRPADNPLIVHFSSLKQLRDLLNAGRRTLRPRQNGILTNGHSEDPIPDIYRPLIERFWPGPLTIILRNPRHSPLAPEVTAGLDTFGARMPRHVLALALIELAGVPIAAPSANASTKPSPTAAEHVLHDLDGRIDTILDGGPCDVGVESTVVDGLSDPPLILRPGGISIEQLRACPGWENTQIGYKSVAETESSPKAPGMKYRHYSPKAPVVLYPARSGMPQVPAIRRYAGKSLKIGMITTRSWEINPFTGPDVVRYPRDHVMAPEQHSDIQERRGFAGMLDALDSTPDPRTRMHGHRVLTGEGEGRHGLIIQEIALGPGVTNVARGMFSALRELDRENVGSIVVEGIDDSEGETAAAIMNRLRKAAETTV